MGLVITSCISESIKGDNMAPEAFFWGVGRGGDPQNGNTHKIICAMKKGPYGLDSHGDGTRIPMDGDTFYGKCSWVNIPFVPWMVWDTPPQTNSLHLKMDGWNTTFLLGPGLFSGAMLVLGRVDVNYT